MLVYSTLKTHSARHSQVIMYDGFRIIQCIVHIEYKVYAFIFKWQTFISIWFRFLSLTFEIHFFKIKIRPFVYTNTHARYDTVVRRHLLM